MRPQEYLAIAAPDEEHMYVLERGNYPINIGDRPYKIVETVVIGRLGSQKALQIHLVESMI